MTSEMRLAAIPRRLPFKRRSPAALPARYVRMNVAFGIWMREFIETSRELNSARSTRKHAARKRSPPRAIHALARSVT